MNISFISLGCDKNLVDSEIMLGLIKENNYRIVSEPADSDIVIVNTCGFILDATEEGIENVLNMAELKNEHKVKGIIVTGCMAQRYQEEIFAEIPEVDAVVGTGDFEKIGEVIKELETELAKDSEKRGKIKKVTDINNKLSDNLSHKRLITTTGNFAYMKIAEGCNNNCTYCKIPSLRGRYRSREIESLIKEAEILASQDIKEIILIAQDTSLYGTDLYDKNMLHVLLRRISEIENIEWIRLLYCYPEHITDETIKEMAENEKVCHYIDMPIQHSENRVLKKMGRGNSKEKLYEVIKKLRTAMPDIAIRTTLITGFPGETEEDFNAMCDFIEEVKFSKLGVFTYSKEDGTPAFNMEDQIDTDIKAERKDILMEIQKSVSNELSRNQIGRRLKVLVEGRIEKEGVYCGRTYMDSYEIDGYVFFDSDDEILSGEFVTVEIKDALDYDLLGVLIDEPCE